MRRAEALLELSREHHTALSIAQRSRRVLAAGAGEDIAATAEDAARRFAAELEPHFLEEERWLLPALAAAGEAALVARTLDEHRQLRQLAGRLDRRETETLAAFAELLIAHVRFEERELFERAQAVIPEDVLRRLAAGDC